MLLASFMVIFMLSDMSNVALSKYPFFDEKACEELSSLHSEEDEMLK